MRKLIFGLVALVFLLLQFASAGLAESPKKGKLLMMTLTKGFRHQTVELSEQIVTEIGDKSGLYETTVTQDVGAFTRDNLKNYDVVMFNTTGELPFTDEEKKDFVDFIRGGKGFVGVHSAIDTFYMWPEFGEMIGGYFNNHPWHEMVTVQVEDPQSPLVGFLAPSFQINDEIYQVSDFQYKDTHVLLRLDPGSVDLKKPGVQRRHYGWPIAWTRSFGKGRVYFNSLGHDEWVWKDARYQKMLQAGIEWAMGKMK
ncbi:MAG: ThuA domain-containing protein [Acidobacteria bacterium]|nr:ThuA domain-containing protein [Acidobacteriota bacterium]